MASKKKRMKAKRKSATKTAASKKHGGGAPRLGLGPRFSIALFKDQDAALLKRMARTRESRAVALRNSLFEGAIK